MQASKSGLLTPISCNKYGESQVKIDEIYPYHKREHRQGAHLLCHVRQAGSCKKRVAEAAI